MLCLCTGAEPSMTCVSTNMFYIHCFTVAINELKAYKHLNIYSSDPRSQCVIYGLSYNTFTGEWTADTGEISSSCETFLSTINCLSKVAQPHDGVLGYAV